MNEERDDDVFLRQGARSEKNLRVVVVFIVIFFIVALWLLIRDEL